MNDNELTIVIPTYNRADSIQKQVSAVIPQLTDGVKLFVIDNSSNYDIYHLFDEYQKRHFSILRNPYNIGADANIAKCFEVCETKWLWTLSDDDIVKPDAVKKVVESINDNKNAIMINYNKEQEICCNSISELLQQCNPSLYSSLFWMSSCVYNLVLLKPFMRFYYSALSTMQPGIALLFRAISNGTGGYLKVIKDKLTIETDEEEISWNRETFIYSSLFLIDTLRDFPKSVFSQIKKNVSVSCLIAVMKSRRGGLSLWKSLCLYREIISRIGHLYSFKHARIYIFYLYSIIRTKPRSVTKIGFIIK